jgi:hypothetical protein
MKPLALVLVLLGSGCGAAVSPHSGDAATDAPAADGALPPCPEVFPGENQACP